jgi:hypothetical protein
MIVSVNILPGSAAGHSDQVVFARAVRLSAIDEFEIERMRRWATGLRTKATFFIPSMSATS